jgi:hypothetical protein
VQEVDRRGKRGKNLLSLRMVVVDSDGQGAMIVLLVHSLHRHHLKINLSFICYLKKISMFFLKGIIRGGL